MRHSHSSDDGTLIAGLLLACVIAAAIIAGVGLLLVTREAFRVHQANARSARAPLLKRAFLLLLAGCGVALLLGLIITPAIGVLVASSSFLCYCVAIEVMDGSRTNPLAAGSNKLLAPWVPGKPRSTNSPAR